MSKGTLVLIGLAMAGAVIAPLGIAAFDWMSWTCRVPSGEAAKLLDLTPMGCFEFWINRYQTLLGAGAAIFAAAVAWAGVSGQIEKANEQIFISQQQLAASALDLHVRRIADLRQIDSTLSIAASNANEGRKWISAAINSINNCFKSEHNTKQWVINSQVCAERQRVAKADEYIENAFDRLNAVLSLKSSTPISSELIAEIDSNVNEMWSFCGGLREESYFLQAVMNGLEKDGIAPTLKNWEMLFGAAHSGRDYTRAIVRTPNIREATRRLGATIDRTIIILEK